MTSPYGSRGLWFISSLLVSTASCMRIYPDPELPDLLAEWPVLGGTCDVGGQTVRIEAIAADGAVESADVTCTDGRGRLEDLARAPYELRIALLDADQAVIGRAEPRSVDLSAGISRRAVVDYFLSEEGLVTLGWTFTGGDSCASVGAVVVQALFTGEDESAGFAGTCADGRLDYFWPVRAGTYSLAVRADDDRGQAVASSPPIADLVIGGLGEVVDLGTIELTRCAGACP